MKLIFKISLVFIVVSISACQSYWEPDTHLGSTVNDVVKMQSANPQAPFDRPEAVKGMDGVSAKASIDNYQNSFTRRGANSGASGGFFTGVQSGSGSNSTNIGIPQQ